MAHLQISPEPITLYDLPDAIRQRICEIKLNFSEPFSFCSVEKSQPEDFQQVDDIVTKLAAHIHKEFHDKVKGGSSFYEIGWQRFFQEQLINRKILHDREYSVFNPHTHFFASYRPDFVFHVGENGRGRVIVEFKKEKITQSDIEKAEHTAVSLAASGFFVVHGIILVDFSYPTQTFIRITADELAGEVKRREGTSFFFLYSSCLLYLALYLTSLY